MIRHGLRRSVLGGLGVLLTATWAASAADGLLPTREVVLRDAQPTLQSPEGAPSTPPFSVAEKPSTFRFVMVEGCETLPADNPGNWSSWSESICASDGNFYTAISDHRGVNGQSFVARYNPETGEQAIVLHTDDLFNHQPGSYGHGKLHGRLDEYPKGRIVGASYWGIPPLDTKYQGELWTGPIPGGRLFGIDVGTGASTDLGCPFERDSWPMFATDTRRGVFFAIGYDRHFLAYDLKRSEVLYAGLPPANIQWFPRCTLVDEETGLCFGTSRGRFVKFDPSTKQFDFLAVSGPKNPDKESIDPNYPGNELRAYTRRRTPEGCYICVTFSGVLFKFFPDEERVEPLGKNLGEGYYSTSMTLSPGGRYVYYTVDAHGDAYRHGSPVIQFDLQENRRKVIAFLLPFFKDQIGYVFGGSYSTVLNADGSQLLITWNGNVAGDKEPQPTFGKPALMLIDIPASERME